MIITRPSDAFKYAIVSGIIDATQQPVVLYFEYPPALCTTCSGEDPFCLTCEGKKYISVTEAVDAFGIVKWKTLEADKYRPEGQYVEGLGSVTFLYTEALESGLVHNVKRIGANNRIFVRQSVQLKGSPPNRIYVILNEDEVNV